MKLLLDKHFSPEIARQLRHRGHDASAARERPELHGLSDHDLLTVAWTEGRTIVTENVADFIELHRQSVTAGEHHAGLVFTSPKQFRRTRRCIGRLVRSLEAFLRSHPDANALRDQLDWLRPA